MNEWHDASVMYAPTREPATNGRTNKVDPKDSQGTRRWNRKLYYSKRNRTWYIFLPPILVAAWSLT